MYAPPSTDELTDPHSGEVTVFARQLPAPHQNVLVRELAFRQIDLIANQRQPSVHVQADAPRQPQVEIVEEHGALLLEIIDVCAALH